MTLLQKKNVFQTKLGEQSCSRWRCGQVAGAGWRVRAAGPGGVSGRRVREACLGACLGGVSRGVSQRCPPWTRSSGNSGKLVEAPGVSEHSAVVSGWASSHLGRHTRPPPGVTPAPHLQAGPRGGAGARRWFIPTPPGAGAPSPGSMWQARGGNAGDPPCSRWPHPLGLRPALRLSPAEEDITSQSHQKIV